MAFLIDTNVAIHLRDRDLDTRAKIDALDDDILLSIISRVELEGGVLRDASRAPERRARLDIMLAGLPVVAFEDQDADAYRLIVETAGYSRRKVLDRMIAAQALVRRATLVTLNEAAFRDVPGLSILAW
jgi:predicted nucleic acid-binding protein